VRTGKVSLSCRAGRVDQSDVETQLRAVVECLLTAHYSEREIIDYLTGPLGVPEADAVRALRELAGPADAFGFA
jgi:hypothetical protein